MRKYVIMFFLICANAVFAQVVPDSVDLRTNSYCAEFENNAPARNKYEIAKKWFSTNFRISGTSSLAKMLAAVRLFSSLWYSTRPTAIQDAISPHY